MTKRLHEDHANAKTLAEGIGQLPWVRQAAWGPALAGWPKYGRTAAVDPLLAAVAAISCVGFQSLQVCSATAPLQLAPAICPTC